MRHFLQLLVDNALAGRAPLKETVIGIEVFGRGVAYDPGAEPIVRVEARRLRRKLGEYYGAAGTSDVVVIDIPKGAYEPRFEFRPAAPFASIAVMPILNLLGDPRQDHLADGLTDGLIARLARAPTLHVISRTSSMRFKEARLTVAEIARELQVDAIVEGAISRSGAQVRIRIQLIDAAADRHMWSRDYRCSIADARAGRDGVTGLIACHVRRNLARSKGSSQSHKL
jgi:TolB-like protein